MPTCQQCHNEYDKTFEIVMNGSSHTFDSFECAIEALAPRCPECNCRIIGHGVEEGESIYCCASCARKDGGSRIVDRA